MDSFTREYTRNNTFNILIENLDYYKKHAMYKNEELVRTTVINKLGLPSGDRFIYEYASNPLVVIDLVRDLAFKFDWREESKIAFTVLKSIEQSPGSLIRVRKVLPSNYVFGHELKTKNSLYCFANGFPYLITRNSRRHTGETELSELTLGNILREEVKTISSLSLILNYGSCNIPINYAYCDIPEFLFHKSKNFNEETPYRAAALLHIFSFLQPSRYESALIRDTKYAFRTEDIDFKKIRLYNNNFKLRDKLALRTAFLLIKSKYLAYSPDYIFMEDACANLFFGLEGCLRLINRRFFGDENFNFKKTIQAIERTFSYAPGYSSMLEDAYNLRVNIVHPESKFNDKWFPILYAEDYHENLEMAADLLYFALTGDFLKNEA
ncbi:hypothetical protein MNQ98_06155 [Paenibacillus sp. N3/727]|uniref:hypothetical protein n=1 Tax=Paenibacillus sp. N3/727 TaxID=2925845 RepID=UPI001F52BADD|nr:hypothetical protein [Paenibacillus sp. N3/727]UNK19612.1 hypothetical protein MNQ98_06155 [Paenibacillus sp. N3/727]